MHVSHADVNVTKVFFFIVFYGNRYLESIGNFIQVISNRNWSLCILGDPGALYSVTYIHRVMNEVSRNGSHLGNRGWSL